MRVAAGLLMLLAGCDNLFDLDPIPYPPDAAPLNGDAVGEVIDPGPCNGTRFGLNGIGNPPGLLSVCLAQLPTTDPLFP